MTDKRFSDEEITTFYLSVGLGRDREILDHLIERGKQAGRDEAVKAGCTWCEDSEKKIAALEAEKICPNCHMPKTGDYHNPSTNCAMEYEYDKGIKDGLWFYDVTGLRAEKDQLQRILDDIPEVTTLQKENARLRDALKKIDECNLSTPYGREQEIAKKALEAKT